MKLVLGVNPLRNVLSSFEPTMKRFPHSNQANRFYLEQKGKNVALVFEGDQKVFSEGAASPLINITLTCLGLGVNPSSLPVLHYRPDDTRLLWSENEEAYMLCRAKEDEVWNWLFPTPEREKPKATKGKPLTSGPKPKNDGLEARRQELTKKTEEVVDYRHLYREASRCAGLKELWNYVEKNFTDARLSAELSPERAKRVRVLRNIQEKASELGKVAEAAKAERCTCGKKLKSECGPDDEWEPGCDLGNNPDHAKPATAEPSPSKL